MLDPELLRAVVRDMHQQMYDDAEMARLVRAARRQRAAHFAALVGRLAARAGQLFVAMRRAAGAGLRRQGAPRR